MVRFMRSIWLILMFDLGQPMFDPVLFAAHIEHMSSIFLSARPRSAAGGQPGPIVAENRMDV